MMYSLLIAGLIGFGIIALVFIFAELMVAWGDYIRRNSFSRTVEFLPLVILVWLIFSAMVWIVMEGENIKGNPSPPRIEEQR